MSHRCFVRVFCAEVKSLLEFEPFENEFGDPCIEDREGMEFEEIAFGGLTALDLCADAGFTLKAIADGSDEFEAFAFVCCGGESAYLLTDNDGAPVVRVDINTGKPWEHDLAQAEKFARIHAQVLKSLEWGADK